MDKEKNKIKTKEPDQKEGEAEKEETKPTGFPEVDLKKFLGCGG
ncbi:MAG: hypothetical protein Tsb0034_18200 [Ekhidna sp.]